MLISRNSNGRAYTLGLRNVCNRLHNFKWRKTLTANFQDFIPNRIRNQHLPSKLISFFFSWVSGVFTIIHRYESCLIFRKMPVYMTKFM